MSLSARRAWIEICLILLLFWVILSLSARRAWIEICLWVLMGGSNWSLSARRAWIEMSQLPRHGRPAHVALRKESVDRNIKEPTPAHDATMSLSARRAWIEILPDIIAAGPVRGQSLSARRAWIEILSRYRLTASRQVALRKESVDRNYSRRACAIL